MTARDEVSPPTTEQGPPAEESPEAQGTSAGSLMRDALVILGVFLVLGGIAGLVWPHLVDPVTVTRTDQGLVTDELGLARRFDNDGWFSVLGFVGGLAGGLVLTAWRRANEVVSVLAITGAAFLASWVAARVGTLTGPADPETVLAHAAVGATAAERVMVTSAAAYEVWPLAAVVGALVVLWGSPGQPLRRRRSRTAE